MKRCCSGSGPTPPGPVSAAIVTAYRAAFRRLSALDGDAFLDACRDLGWRDSYRGLQLGPALCAMAAEGSIDAAAALNVMAVEDPEVVAHADSALAGLFRRNPAAQDEMVTAELVQMLEEQAPKLGLVKVVDPASGETRWRWP